MSKAAGMLLDPVLLATRISAETGFALTGEGGVDADGHQWLGLVPLGHEQAHTFSIHVAILWRRLRIEFVPGRFARPLLDHMSHAAPDGRSAFEIVLADCVHRRAVVEMQVDTRPVRFDDPSVWGRDWSRFSLSLTRANIELGVDEGPSDFDLVSEWLLRFAAATLALLPLEPLNAEAAPELPAGFPEGDREAILVNRYERDRRNRAAALAIHGTRCRACDMDFGERYGPAAAGYIEIDHVTPVSKLGPGYIINPAKDLVPLCANCHRVAHRTDPPMAIDIIIALMNPESAK